MFKKQYSKEQGFQKLKQYCAWQERAQQEAKEKAYSLGLRKTEVEEVLSQLILENFLNEERFAVQFTGGKFRIKKWGRVKIKYELHQKKVSNYCITKALETIDESEYLELINKLASLKWNSIKGSGANLFVKMAKTKNYLLQKGFEPQLVSVVLKKITNTKQ